MHPLPPAKPQMQPCCQPPELKMNKLLQHFTIVAYYLEHRVQNCVAIEECFSYIYRCIGDYEIEI